MKAGLFASAATVIAIFLGSSWVSDDTPPADAKGDEQSKARPDDAADALVKLFPASDVWLDKKRNAVVLDGQVCLREGLLEMFACPKGTKEHESVVSLNCKAEEVHAALLAAGAKPGSPVSFDPEYKPA